MRFLRIISLFVLPILLFAPGTPLLSQEEAPADNPANPEAVQGQQELPDDAPQPSPKKKPAVEFPPPSPEEIKMEIENDVNKFEIEMSEEDIKVNEIFNKARIAFQNNDYENAINLYLEAKKKLLGLGGANPSARIKAKLDSVDEAMSVAYYYWAQSVAAKAEEVANANQYDSAIEKCKEAKRISPSTSARMDAMIEKYEKMKDVLKFRKETSKDTLLPDANQRTYNLEVLYEQGKTFYYDGQYDKARDKFEQILIINPYHINTIRFMKLVNQKLFQSGSDRLKLTLKERLTESEWKYVTPLLPRTFTGEKEIVEAPIEKKEGVSDIQKKLESIIIDRMEFEEVSVPVVVKYLKMKSKELDKEGEGVNIFLRLSGGGAAPAPAAGGEGGAAAPAPAEGAEGGAAPAAEGANAEEEAGNLTDGALAAPGSDMTVTILVEDIPLIEAIKYVCRGVNLKWRVEKYAVVIASPDVALDELETRIYPVEQETFSEFGGGGGGGEEGGAAATGQSAAIQQFFVQRGVTFPEGAKVVYDSAISRLIATNTPDNLEKIEKVLKEMNITDPQVLIEAKFVEIAQQDMNSLGFEWLVSRPSSLSHPPLSDKSMTFNQNDPLLRFSDDVSPIWTNNRDVIFNVTKHSSDGVTYQALVHALNTSESTDILSTPRITTQNGEEATIRMITEVYLPESWSDANYIPAGGGGGGAAGWGDIFTPSVPQFGSPTELGVRLTVTPQVDADRYTIALDMTPVLQAFIGWIDYSYQVPAANGNFYTNTLRMPIIEARTITTQMQIYDGETVVMGGVTRDTSGYIDDRIPGLGSIPVVGRLFQSKVEDLAKRNLLIFTTVRLVQPDGSPYRAREIRGLPPFRQ